MYKKQTNFSILILLVIIGVSFSSCKKYLDEQPISAYSYKVAFADVPSAFSTLLGAYSQMAGEEGYGKVLSLYSMVDDDAMTGPAGFQTDRRAMAHYTSNSLNLELNKSGNPFVRFYTGIERANLCIKYIPQMAQYTGGTPSEQNELHRMYGEALTLRAQYYFGIITNWGDVPAQFVPALDLPDLYLPKTDKNVIYDHLLNDLKIAETIVPWRSAVAHDERITQGAVRALRARIALFRGGYSLSRRLPISVGVPAVGEMRRASDYLQYYQIAHDECDTIIKSGEHALNTSYEQVFRNLDSHIIDPSGEILFEVAMSGSAAETSSRLGDYDGPKAPTAFSTASFQNAITILPTYFYSFDSLDTRRDVTCAPFVYTNNVSWLKKSTNIAAISFAKYRFEWIANGSTFTTNNFDINWPLIRYSDVLLMFAEADNELNGAPSADAITALEQVRTRAFGGNSALIGTTPTDHDGFFNAIVNERSYEFGGEGIRKYDLIRWNLITAKLNDARNKMLYMINTGLNPYGTDSIPRSMFYLNNSTTLQFGNSLYHPTPKTTPSGYTKTDWMGPYLNLSANPQVFPKFYTTANVYAFYAVGFQPNHSELFPIGQDIINSNPKLTQDYGY